MWATQKQASVDDLIAAAEWLIAKRYTNPQKLAFFGTAGGGLLGGIAITQRPGRSSGPRSCSTPLTDMLRFDRFLQGPWWVSEFGSPADPVQFGWLSAYSPYQQVKNGVRYPAVFLAGHERSRRYPRAPREKDGGAAAGGQCRASRPTGARLD